MVLNDKKKSIEFFTSELIIFFPLFYDIYLIRFNKISRFYIDNFIHNIIYSIKRLHIYIYCDHECNHANISHKSKQLKYSIYGHVIMILNK